MSHVHQYTDKTGKRRVCTLPSSGLVSGRHAHQIQGETTNSEKYSKDHVHLYKMDGKTLLTGPAENVDPN